MPLQAVYEHAVGRGSRFREPSLVGARDLVRAAIILGAVIADIILILLGCLTGSSLHFGGQFDGSALGLGVALAPAYLLGCGLLRAYQMATLRHRVRSAGTAVMSLGVAVCLGLAAVFALHATAQVYRLETGTALVAAGIYLMIGRSVGAVLISALRSVIDPVILLFGDLSLPEVSQSSCKQINVARRGWEPDPNNPAFLTQVFEAVRHSDRVLLAFQDPGERRQWADIMRLTGIDAEIIDPSLSDHFPIAIGKWEGLPTLVISRGPLSLGERVLKRGFDLAIVLSVAPITVPLIAAAALLVRLGSPGPALFVQERVGRNNRRYRCYKLRSMRGDQTDHSGERSTGRDDERVTRIGRLLRRTSLDELPQLWNVFIGEMSLVGPRPHALGSTAGGALFWDVVDGYWVRHSVKPGITGLAQARGLRGATDSRRDLELRVAADLEYINHWSIWLDVRVILKTISVLTHRNAF